jgi:hypothetical protein
MPTGFFIWGYMYPFTFIVGGTSKFLGVQSLTHHLGVQRKLTAFSPCKAVHHAVFCNYYAELAKTYFFCLTLGQTGTGVLSDPWPLCLSHHFFGNIVYNLSNFVFYTELNARLPRPKKNVCLRSPDRP